MAMNLAMAFPVAAIDIDTLAVVACVALTAAVLIFVFMIEPDPGDSAPHRTQLDQLMERRDIIYDNLRDLKFEYRTGKFAEEDYEQMRQTLETEAALVLAEMEHVTGNPSALPRSDAPVRARRRRAQGRELAMPRAKRHVILSEVGARFFSVRFWRRAAAQSKNLSWALPSRALACFALVIASAAAAAAGTVTGVIHNGTNGNAVAPGVDVILIQLQGGMQPVANTKSDAKGQYKFDYPAIGQGPMLIRAVYHGVMFHQPLVPGHDTVDVTVYDPSSDSKIVNVGSRVVVFQPNGDKLVVGEEYSLQNQSQPPKAYFNEKGDFDFEVPEGSQLSQVSSWGPSGMPVVQGTMDRGKGKYAIAYAFQPGDNGVRFSYQVPYPSNHADVRLSSDYTVGRVLLVAAPSVQINSPGFMPAGTEQGFNLYTRDSVPAGLPFDVSVSGTAPPPQATPDQSQGQGNDQDPTVNSRVNESVQALPNRLDSLRWIIIGGFAALFALGVLMIWRKPDFVPGAPAGAGDMPVPSSPSGPRGKRKSIGSQGASQAAAAPSAPARTASFSPVATPAPSVHAAPIAPAGSASSVASVASAVSDVDVPAVEREVQNGLDSLKDRLFRLELRRQAGTISDEDYARERARTEQILRELVRG